MHVIAKDGIVTDLRKIETVANWQPLKHFFKLSFFWGVASYYRHVVEEIAMLSTHLHHLAAEQIGTKTRRATEKWQSVLWPEECQCSFDELQDRFVIAPVFAYTNLSLPFI